MPANDPEPDNGIAIQDYWSALTALGLRSAQRITDDNFIMTTRDGDTTTVADPGKLSPVERVAVLELLKARVG